MRSLGILVVANTGYCTNAVYLGYSTNFPSNGESNYADRFFALELAPFGFILFILSSIHY